MKKVIWKRDKIFWKSGGNEGGMMNKQIQKLYDEGRAAEEARQQKILMDCAAEAEKNTEKWELFMKEMLPLVPAPIRKYWIAVDGQKKEDWGLEKPKECYYHYVEFHIDGLVNFCLRIEKKGDPYHWEVTDYSFLEGREWLKFQTLPDAIYAARLRFILEQQYQEEAEENRKRIDAEIAARSQTSPEPTEEEWFIGAVDRYIDASVDKALREREV